ncbi:hypothetical protein F7725_014849 [Dissostichus mawsoni]|uniref:Uncharacterized protein n=1 Tax=Dissostichus mawsoni TaxID=36200 RepID=A0A7J5YFW3_DISMA|nr:hypothetical protein F7725_014849 [Dissostichus mawsoni]
MSSSVSGVRAAHERVPRDLNLHQLLTVVTCRQSNRCFLSLNDILSAERHQPQRGGLLRETHIHRSAESTNLRGGGGFCSERLIYTDLQRQCSDIFSRVCWSSSQTLLVLVLLVLVLLVLVLLVLVLVLLVQVLLVLVLFIWCPGAPMVRVLVLVLVLAAAARALSGDGDGDSGVVCSSHLLLSGCSLSCQLGGGGGEDDEDEDEEALEKMSLHRCQQWVQLLQCLRPPPLVSPPLLNPVIQYRVTLLLRGGGSRSRTLDLKTVVKPRPPQVSLSLMDSQVLIRLQSPDSNDYLRDDNQLFQIQLWRGGRSTLQNLSSPSLLLVLDQYRVRGQLELLEPDPDPPADPAADPPRRPALIGGLLVLLLLPSGLLLLLKNRIFSYLWPNIPHPKHTLMHFCKSNKGLMLTLRPEEFSSLRLEKTGEAAPPPPPRAPPPLPPPLRRAVLWGGQWGGNEYVTMSSFMQSD